VGCSGVTPDFGFSMRDGLESAIARAFLNVSQRAIVVADHGKVGQKTLARFTSLTGVERLITDERLESSWQTKLEQAGLKVEVAKHLPYGQK
jgi:DeoR/GlpR family transcriptional regulator of sugar metabolism